jgi:hypothetical protein
VFLSQVLRERAAMNAYEEDRKIQADLLRSFRERGAEAAERKALTDEYAE